MTANLQAYESCADTLRHMIDTVPEGGYNILRFIEREIREGLTALTSVRDGEHIDTELLLKSITVLLGLNEMYKITKDHGSTNQTNREPTKQETTKVDPSGSGLLPGFDQDDYDIQFVTLALSLGWVDTSYSNDTYPSLQYGTEDEDGDREYRLWIAPSDPTMREEADDTQFLLERLHRGEGQKFVKSNDLNQVVVWLTAPDQFV